jgi:hypothetical protein
MFDNTTLEHYSTLEEMSSVTPVWRPFDHHSEPAQSVAHAEREASEAAAQ